MFFVEIVGAVLFWVVTIFVCSGFLIILYLSCKFPDLGNNPDKEDKHCAHCGGVGYFKHQCDLDYGETTEDGVRGKCPVCGGTGLK